MTTIVFVMIVLMVAFMVMMVNMPVSGPRRKGIGGIAPTLLALRHLVVGEETTIELILEVSALDAERHDGE